MRVALRYIESSRSPSSSFCSISSGFASGLWAGRDEKRGVAGASLANGNSGQRTTVCRTRTKPGPGKCGDFDKDASAELSTAKSSTCVLIEVKDKSSEAHDATQLSFDGHEFC